MINETKRTFGSRINGTKWKIVGKTISLFFNLLALAFLFGFMLDKIPQPLFLAVEIPIVVFDTLIEFFGLLKL